MQQLWPNKEKFINMLVVWERGRGKGGCSGHPFVGRFGSPKIPIIDYAYVV